jgi:hypothetical protein
MEWEQFNDEVIAHIASYCIPQYGNAPDDEVGAWTAKDCMRAIAKYLGRYGKNARGDADQERDFLKIAHYACLAYWRWKEGKR